ncbi:hypothetical protein FACS1894182_12880 [Bacteroidia bacterium]|nr:hypothetical protein FACS1894182_12880 [Bacteroidia bacterium]
MKLEKIKLRNIVNEQLTTHELELLKGGEYITACTGMVCHSQLDRGVSFCTNGDPICTKQMAM